MFRLKRILLIAPSKMIRTPAFERAHSLACAKGALLHIVAFDDAQVSTLAGLMDREAMAEAREGYLKVHHRWLEQQARFQCDGALSVTTDMVRGKPSLNHILKYVNDFQADLVIKDIEYVQALNHAVHRPLDWWLLRDCPAPLHLVTDASPPKPLKVLAAVDLSHLEDLTQGLNDRILDLARTLADCCGADLHMLNVSSWSVLGDSADSVPTASLDDSLRDAVIDTQEEAFEELAERYGIEKKCRHLVPGIPHKVIEQFVRKQAFDMLVLGALYQHRLDRFIGSTAEHVLNRAPCSMVIVKPLSRPV